MFSKPKNTITCTTCGMIDPRLAKNLTVSPGYEKNFCSCNKTPEDIVQEKAKIQLGWLVGSAVKKERHDIVVY